MKTLIIGLGVSGCSAARFLLERGEIVHGVDDSDVEVYARLADLIKSGLIIESQDLDISIFDRVIVSPGVPQEHSLVQQARCRGIDVIGEAELALQRMKDRRVIGITGTNGKTTVTSLVAHLLTQCGITACAAGNVGIPLTSREVMDHQDAIIVAELSSYQLETLVSRTIDIGVILNISPDHLDRYSSMESYAQAKLCIKDCLKPDGMLYVSEEVAMHYGHQLRDADITIIGNFDAKDLPSRLQDHPDFDNFIVAYSVCRQLGLGSEDIIEGIKTFRKPPHRLEFVKTIDGVHYYDDSKGTNLEAVIRAVTVLKGSIILIAGGVHKGASYRAWLESFRGKVKKVFAMGEAASKIYEDLRMDIPVEIVDTLERAVRGAAAVAQSGDYVLLSPGCSSFDMFKDYCHRGEEFKRLAMGSGLTF